MAGISPLKAHHWHLAHDAQACAEAAADFLAQAIIQILQQKPQCLIALPGGQTPVQCLQLLATKDLPWSQCHWFLGDERCYPVDHSDRNDTMIKTSFLQLIDVPEHHFHAIASEQGAESAARQYSDLLESFGTLDIAFLGMGEDGHTASLFPDNPGLDQNESVIAVYNAPKPPPDRVSLSRNTLLAAQIRLVLVTGVGKQAVIRQIKHDTPLPVNTIGPIHWFLDQAADGS